MFSAAASYDVGQRVAVNVTYHAKLSAPKANMKSVAVQQNIEYARLDNGDFNMSRIL
jgi:hypothetical protein